MQNKLSCSMFLDTQTEDKRRRKSDELHQRNDNGARRRRRKTICKSFGASQSKSEFARSFRGCLTTQSKFRRLATKCTKVYIANWIEKIHCSDGWNKVRGKRRRARLPGGLHRDGLCRSVRGDFANFNDSGLFGPAT